MLFRILHDERSGELSYVLADNDAREAVVVDPRSRDLPVLQALLGERDLRLRWVLRTHQHDHLQSHELERLRSMGAPVVQGETREGTHTVADGERLPVGHESLRVITTPGHTAGCLSFAWRDRVFCGGLLAVDACPHQPHPADPAALWDSINLRLFTLPDETLLFAGHEQRARAVSTVLEQRRWHPFFARQTRDAFLARVAALPAHASTAAPAAPGRNTPSA